MQVLTSAPKTVVSATTQKAVSLLKQLIAIPSFSKEENKTADLLEAFLHQKEIGVRRKANNVWACNKFFDASKPTILLNSHHDTVRPNAGYTSDPFLAHIKDGKLYGLGSNDAGGALVSLLFVFLHFYDSKELKYNLIFSATAEEEISGANGISAIVNELPEISFAIVGEPTLMHLAVAEKGLLVLDCLAEGKAGHAARDEGDNAIYKALKDIAWFRDFSFPKISATLGGVKMNVTMIGAGQQHNVMPDACNFTVDVRTTDAYTNEEVLTIVEEHVSCKVTPRSLRLQPSSIEEDHPIVRAAKKLERKTYGSPTLSDLALMPWPSVKIGPGDSGRSHTADEFIYLEEIENGIELYIQMLEEII